MHIDHSAIDGNLRKAIEAADLDAIRSYARQLGRPLSLHQAARVLPTIRRWEPQQFDRAAARWVGRLVLERRAGLAEVDRALVALDPVFPIDVPTLIELADLPLSAEEARKPLPGVERIQPDGREAP
jgi:hypothetical protein